MPEVVITGGQGLLSGIDEGGAVLCTHPFNDITPATIDFSNITLDRVGTLTLVARCYPRKDGRVVVKVDGRNFGTRESAGEDG